MDQENTLATIAADPFEPWVYKLRVPLKKGEVEVYELTLKPPELGDMVRADGHAPESLAYARALLSALSGVPEIVLNKIVPEDWADIRLILTMQNARFTGQINLLDKPGEDKDPTKAADAKHTPPPNSGTTSGA